MDKFKLSDICREQLEREYNSLRVQAHISFILWAASFAVGVGIIGVSIVLVFMGRYIEGASINLLQGLVYYMQKLFSKREDYYRGLIIQKLKRHEDESI